MHNSKKKNAGQSHFLLLLFHSFFLLKVIFFFNKKMGNSNSNPSPNHEKSNFIKFNNEITVNNKKSNDDESSAEEAEQFHAESTENEKKAATASKSINILLLGETGVGKSTWINGLANYLTYETLMDAEAHEPMCLIPSKFSITDINYDQKIVRLGDSTNECFEDGASSTQIPVCYKIHMENDKILRIIDTPGIGDTRGAEKDSENLSNILSHISQFKELHGICVLLKPNSSRLTVMFKYCISELLTHLHKSAAKNIVFCFTNARSTFYKPGDTFASLKKLLLDLKSGQGVDIPLNKETIYCVDNEAFRLLCCLHNQVDFGEDERPNFCKSWEKSAQEMHRLISHFKSIPPHSIQDTISLNEARRIILTLAKPLADISQNIQDNINALEHNKQSLQKLSEKDSNLKQKLLIPEIGLEVQQLGHPRTVCTGTKCIETMRLPYGEVIKVIYKTICHDHCFLENIIPEKVPCPELQSCAAMNGTMNCVKCECSWSLHMHITFTQVQTSNMVEDKDISQAIKSNKRFQDVQQLAITKNEEKVKEFQEEQKKIDQICAKFGAFLKKHAILPYNDAIEDYLKMNIGEAERIGSLVDNRQKIKMLKQQLVEYQEQKRILDQRLTKRCEHVVNPSQIKLLQQQLQSLKLSGPKIKKLFEATVFGHQTNFKFNEQFFDPSKFRKKKIPIIVDVSPEVIDQNFVNEEKSGDDASDSIQQESENMTKVADDDVFSSSKFIVENKNCTSQTCDTTNNMSVDVVVASNATSTCV